MVLVPDADNNKPADAEWETAAEENASLEESTGVDPNITGVNTTTMTTSIGNLSVIIYKEGINKDNSSDKEDNDISEWGDSNGPESSNNASNSGRDQWLPIIKMVYEYIENETDSK